MKQAFELTSSLKEAQEMESAEQLTVSVMEKMITWHQVNFDYGTVEV